jgi:hypothetical protein
MANNCLVGCIGENQCIGGSNGGILYPFAVAAPFIEVTFGAGNNTLTVGNQSDPENNNNACIIGLNISTSNGMNAKIEVVDQEGGQFYNFFDSLIKHINSTEPSICLIDYGWIGSDCDNNPIKRTMASVSGSRTEGQIIEMNVTKSSGLYSYEINCGSLMTIAQAGKTQKTYGFDGVSKYKLDLAITQYCQDPEQPPVFKQVNFWRKQKGGGTQTWEFKAIHDVPQGPWRTNNQGKLETILEWIQDWATDQGKGMVLSIDEREGKRSLILWEDPHTPCQNDNECAGDRLGTFIVNGGNCSNVLEFNPTINWSSAWASKTIGGEQGGPTAAVGVPLKDNFPNNPNGCNQGEYKQEGKTGNILLNNNLTTNTGEQALKIAAANRNANELANSKFQVASSLGGMMTAIEADLKIIGTVEMGFTHIYDNLFGYCSIIVINPFYLSRGGTDSCPKWIYGQSCNTVLTDTNWQLQQITHDIRGGKFETTLHVYLASGIYASEEN